MRGCSRGDLGQTRNSAMWPTFLVHFELDIKFPNICIERESFLDSDLNSSLVQNKISLNPYVLLL